MEALSYSWPSLAMAVDPLLALLIYFLLPEQYSDEKVAESGPGALA